MNDVVNIYTDGACRGNPGPGGWGAIVRCGEREKELYGAEKNTTNNRMELMAAIQALESLRGKQTIILTTDSTYVKNGICEWMPNWKKKSWLTAAKKPVKNKDLWQRLDSVAAKHQIEWRWVKGHSGHAENERADDLANRAIDEL